MPTDCMSVVKRPQIPFFIFWLNSHKQEKRIFIYMEKKKGGNLILYFQAQRNNKGGKKKRQYCKSKKASSGEKKMKFKFKSCQNSYRQTFTENHCRRNFSTSIFVTEKNTASF